MSTGATTIAPPCPFGQPNASLPPYPRHCRTIPAAADDGEMDDQDQSQPGQDSGGSGDEDVQMDVAGSAEEQCQFSTDDLVAAGYQPESDPDSQNYA